MKVSFCLCLLMLSKNKDKKQVRRLSYLLQSWKATVMQSTWFLVVSVPGIIHVCFGWGYTSCGSETLHSPDTQLFKVKFAPSSGDLWLDLSSRYRAFCGFSVTIFKWISWASLSRVLLSISFEFLLLVL